MPFSHKQPFHTNNIFVRNTKLSDRARAAQNYHHTSVRTVIHNAAQDYNTHCGQKKTRSKMQFYHTWLKQIKYSRLCLTGVHLRDIANTIFVILPLNVGHLNICSYCSSKLPIFSHSVGYLHPLLDFLGGILPPYSLIQKVSLQSMSLMNCQTLHKTRV